MYFCHGSIKVADCNPKKKKKEEKKREENQTLGNECTL
jgi:hypothetical protein